MGFFKDVFKRLSFIADHQLNYSRSPAVKASPCSHLLKHVRFHGYDAYCCNCRQWIDQVNNSK